MRRWRWPVLCVAGVVVLLAAAPQDRASLDLRRAETTTTTRMDEPYKVEASLDGVPTTCTIDEELRDGVRVIRFIDCDRLGS